MCFSNFKVFPLALSALLLISLSLVSCQQQPSLLPQLQAKGRITPQNWREKIIFDYFQAIKAERYEYAYSLLAPKIRGHYADYVEDLKINHRFLPEAIAIGEEYPAEYSTYGYLIHYITAGNSNISSGRMLLVPRAQQPGNWYIAYSSAI